MTPTIAYIAGQFPKQSETFVWREVRELRRRGWTVHTFGLHAPDESTPPSLLDLREQTTVIYERFGKPINPLALGRGLMDGLKSNGTKTADRLKLTIQSGIGSKLAREIHERNIEHIHAHFAHAPASVAMYAARSARIPFSFTGHANDLFQRRQALAIKLKRAGFVACISQWHRELYRSIVPRGDEAYPIIRCGVETIHWMPKSSLGSEGSLKLITVGRLVEKKGIDLLVEAVIQLLKSGRKVSLTIAGDGPQRAQIETIIQREGASEFIKLLGTTESETVRRLMLEHDAFALPCRIDSQGDKDGIPVVLMEAMACGLPVISGDLPAVRELISHESSGLLVDAEKNGELRGAIQQLLDSIELRQRLSTGGRERVVSEFDLRQNVDRLVDAISTCKRGRG